MHLLIGRKLHENLHNTHTGNPLSRLGKDAAFCLTIWIKGIMDTVEHRRILVLDDEPDVLKLLKTYLGSLGFEILTTSSWTEAIDMITHNAPDVVLLDLQMPTIQGEKMLDFIREQDETLPVVIISAFLDKDKIDELSRKGANGFLPKPFQLEEIKFTIQKLFRSSPSSIQPPPPPAEPSPSRRADPVEARVSPPSPPPRPPIPGADSSILPPRRESEQAEPHEHSRRRRSHRHPSRKRKSNSLTIYVAITVLCLLGSLAYALMQNLPSYMTEFIYKTVDQSLKAGTSFKREKAKGVYGKEDEEDREDLDR